MKHQKKINYIAPPIEGVQTPQAVELEEIVLGSMLLDEDIIPTAIEYLNINSFYKEQNGEIFEAIKSLFLENKKVDLITVVERLRQLSKLEDVGGAYYIATLTNNVASTTNTEQHVSILSGYATLRNTINFCHQTMRRAYSLESPDEILTDISAFASNSEITLEKEKSISEVMDELAKRVENAKSGFQDNSISTGYKKLDTIHGGREEGKLYIYAAKPGMGKTAVIVNEAYHQLKQGKAVVFHSLEMTATELLGRLVALYIDECPSLVNRGQVLNETLFKEAEQFFKNSKLTILENDNLQKIHAKTKRLKLLGLCDIAYLDYIQIMNTSNSHSKKSDEITEFAYGLKKMAKDLLIPVVALAQLNRNTDARASKRPAISDIKESGGVEEAADVVQMLFRPEYYSMDTYNFGNGEEDTKGKILFITEKNRSGDCADVMLFWNGAKNKVSEEKDGFEEDVIAKQANWMNNFQPNFDF